MSLAKDLQSKIERRTATIAVVGLGYVGLPLVGAIHAAGFRTIGFDIDQSKIERLRRGDAYIRHLEAVFTTLAASDRFEATSDPSRMVDADVILLCVPTPLGAHREPDLQFVLGSTRTVESILRAGQLVVLESSTYPGTTREQMLPILESSGLRCGRDFFLAYSPEREDPGSVGRSAVDVPKVVGGIEPLSGALAEAFYKQVVHSVVATTSTEVAEASKLLENIYRAVNIAMVNELKLVFDAMGIDIWEVIAAASTKPFGFHAFKPGPGLGGHCIPVDPFYLSWKAREAGQSTRFIELAGEINAAMPAHVVRRLGDALNDSGIAMRKAKVLVLGIAYKKNIDDIRETPAAPIIEMLEDAGVEVSYHDPHMPVFPSMRKHAIELRSVELNPTQLAAVDAVLIVTDHDSIDWPLVGTHAKLVIDTRNAMDRVAAPIRARVVKA